MADKKLRERYLQEALGTLTTNTSHVHPRIDPVRYMRISPSDMDKIASLVVERLKNGK